MSQKGGGNTEKRRKEEGREEIREEKKGGKKCKTRFTRKVHVRCGGVWFDIVVDKIYLLRYDMHYNITDFLPQFIFPLTSICHNKRLFIAIM